MIDAFVNYFELDFWVLWGLAAQSFFFLRLIIQWLRSEKAQKTVVPLSFWWLGILGALMLFVYALVRRDLVFLLTSVLQLLIYARNFKIALNDKSEVLHD